nr:MAG TPA: hypothetical protein [Caudoviricetes sp.]
MNNKRKMRENTLINNFDAERHTEHTSKLLPPDRLNNTRKNIFRSKDPKGHCRN